MLIRASCWWFQRFSLYFRVFFVGMGLSSEFAVFPSDHFDFVSFVGFGFSVDGICAEHLSVESYTIFICQQSYLLLFWYSITTHSFFRGLKPFFSANPSHCSPSFFFFNTHYTDFPYCLLLFLSISVFYF